MPRIRTGFAFRQAAGKLEEVMARLRAVGYPAAPITDTASTFGFVKWAKLCKAAHLKPVFGVELGVTPSIHAKKPVVDHFTFIARHDVRAVFQAVELATTQFRYQPLLTYAQVNELKGLWVIAGHRARLEDFMPGPDRFVALGPAVSRGYANAVNAAGHRWIAASDNRYAAPGDMGLYEVIAGRNAGAQTYPQHILTAEEWRAAVSKTGLDSVALKAAEETAEQLMAAADAQLLTAHLLKPERPATLLAMCRVGARDLGVNLDDPVYAERLAMELELIEAKSFEDYFYIVADIMNFARQHLMVGPARGSSCGSLVCYLLRITAIDPIPFGLLFQRFVSMDRYDLPDIDIDLDDTRRQLVFDYVTQKYGADRVARLGTIAYYRPRSALQEAGAALRIPKWKTENVLGSLVVRKSGDSRALQTLEDTFDTTPSGQKLTQDHPEIRITQRMEGHPRNYSQHAAGIVISEEPINHYFAIDQRSGAVMGDKYDAEALNLLKIDALGLTQLSVFSDTLEQVGMDRHALEKVPLDDAAAFDVLNRQEYAGIFQYQGLALQSIATQFKVDKFDDIVATTALARPGPLASGGATQWVRRRNGLEPVTYAHPIFEPYLKSTYGAVLYQEQVMTIGKEVGDMGWEEVTALRKAMSRSLGKEFFDQYGDKWKPGAIRKGVPPEVADKAWNDLCQFGSWSFNAAHAVAYGMVSYWCCWLKAHHPLEFAAATLTHTGDPGTQLEYLRELDRGGYGYVPVDPQQSTDRWRVATVDGQRRLIGPLGGIVGIGPKGVTQILSCRARGEPLPERLQKLLTKPRTNIDTLYPIRDAFKTLLPDPTAKNIISTPVAISDIQYDMHEPMLIFCVVERINPRDENEAVWVARRGYEIKKGPTTSLNLQMTDDSGTVYGKVSRWDYERLGKPIVDYGRPGKALYAIKGRVPEWKNQAGGATFRMVMIDNVRYIGDLG